MSPPHDQNDEINLSHYLEMIVRHRRLVSLIVGVSSILAVLYSLLATKIYKAEVTIMPVKEGRSGGGLSSLIAQASDVPVINLGVGLMGGSSLNAQLMTLLGSRTLSERLVSRFHLMEVFYKEAWDKEKKEWKIDDPPTLSDGAKIMKGFFLVEEDKRHKVFSISVQHPDPKFATELANTIPNELQILLNEFDMTVSKKSRRFIGEQLEFHRAKLLNVGKDIAYFNVKGRGSDDHSTFDVPVEVRLTPDPWDNTGGEGMIPSTSLEGEIQKSKNDLSDLEQKISSFKKVTGVPQQIYLEYLVLQKRLLIRIVSLLTQQYEMARIEEVQSQLSFQVIDPAVMPKRKYKPKRTIICLAVFSVSLIFSIILCQLLEFLKDNTRLANNKLFLKLFHF